MSPASRLISDDADCWAAFFLIVSAVLSAVEADTILVSLMSSSNELGTIQAVNEVACRLQGHGILLHTDAVQSAGKVPLDVTSLRVDLLSLSSHKMGGPPGIGCLWIREGTTLSPMLRGGGQEANRRAGTEPLALIVGFGVAAELAGSEMSTVSERVRHLREGLEQDLEARFGPLWFHGRGSPRLPNTVSVGFPGHRGEDLVMALDLEGVAVSTGSACAVGTVRPSHVLEAIGCSPEEARSTLRISLGRETTPNDLRHFLEVLASVLTRKPLLRRTRGREVGAAPRDRSAGLVKR